MTAPIPYSYNSINIKLFFINDSLMHLYLEIIAVANKTTAMDTPGVETCQ